MKHLGIKLLTLLIFVVGCTNHYEEGKKFFDNEDYEKSKSEFKKVSENDKNYNNAQLHLTKADSLIVAIRREEFVKDSIAIVKEKIRKDSFELVQKELATENEIDRLQEELKSLKTFDGAEYRGDVNSLIVEVALFSTWGKMAKEAKNNENLTIKNLGNNIEQNLKSLQLREFPKIRANYAKILNNKLWESNIEVRNFGSGNTTLQFTGGILASNKNKQDLHTTLTESFIDFRFKRVNYKWYKYDDEYIYYTITSHKDGEIITY